MSPTSTVIDSAPCTSQKRKADSLAEEDPAEGKRVRLTTDVRVAAEFTVVTKCGVAQARLSPFKAVASDLQKHDIESAYSVADSPSGRVKVPTEDVMPRPSESSQQTPISHQDNEIAQADTDDSDDSPEYILTEEDEAAIEEAIAKALAAEEEDRAREAREAREAAKVHDLWPAPVVAREDLTEGIIGTGSSHNASSAPRQFFDDTEDTVAQEQTEEGGEDEEPSQMERLLAKDATLWKKACVYRVEAILQLFEQEDVCANVAHAALPYIPRSTPWAQRVCSRLLDYHDDDDDMGVSSESETHEYEYEYAYETGSSTACSSRASSPVSEEPPHSTSATAVASSGSGSATDTDGDAMAISPELLAAHLERARSAMCAGDDLPRQKRPLPPLAWVPAFILREQEIERCGRGTPPRVSSDARGTLKRRKALSVA
ncbi:hypothetical protein WOLCODRAFT_163980 [Wolfiporia cocos MD-104 SS10]|uniref:Uncharacterized protein n=1 Tax=Wolfiporia cocos (strain MD-104) TaxID=742152 RepID=A0A2H3K2R9_WOLCO|nr:hypothetical protein WOLCODRAFT_163980 [Wolfiporia cocos MD-104 SS10]